jgi:hypothetical protein
MALWTPLDLGAKLRAWYDFQDASTVTESGGAISQVTDKSGNGFTLSEGTAGNRMTYSATGFNGTLPAAVGVDSDRLRNITTGVWPSSNVRTWQRLDQTTLVFTILGGAPTRSITATASDLFVPVMLGVTVDGTTINQYENGNLLSASGATTDVVDQAAAFAVFDSDTLHNTSGDRIFDQTSGLAFTLANRGDGARDLLGGYGEFVSIDGVLTTDERQRLEGYLAHKWDLEGNLDAGHPYKSAPPDRETFSGWEIIQRSTHETATAGTTHTATWPTTPTAGNLLVLISHVDKSASYGADPSGFTAGPVVDGTDASVKLWWKIAAGTETTHTVTLGSSGERGLISLLEFSGVDTSSTIDETASTDQTNGADNVTITVTAANVPDTADQLAIVAVSVDTVNAYTRGLSVSGTEGTWRAEILRAGVADPTGQALAIVGWKVIAGTGSAVSSTVAYTGTNDAMAGVLATFRVDAGGTAYSLACASGSFAVTGTAAGLKAGRKIAGASGAYSLTGTAAGLKAGRKLAAASGSFTLTGTAAGLAADRALSADSGSYSLTGTAAGLRRGFMLSGASGAYTVTGTAAGLEADRRLAAASGSFAVTGTAVTLTKTGAYELAASSGSFTVTGTAAGLAADRALAADSGSFAVTGTDATLTYDEAEPGAFTLAAESGSFAVSGSNVVLLYSGARRARDGDGGTNTQGRRNRYTGRRMYKWQVAQEVLDAAESVLAIADPEDRQEQAAEVLAAIGDLPPMFGFEMPADAPVVAVEAITSTEPEVTLRQVLEAYRRWVDEDDDDVIAMLVA